MDRLRINLLIGIDSENSHVVGFYLNECRMRANKILKLTVDQLQCRCVRLVGSDLVERVKIEQNFVSVEVITVFVLFEEVLIVQLAAAAIGALRCSFLL